MKIQGVPDGFEIRSVYDAQGLADACVSGQKLQEGERVVCAIIRPVGPICTWQHGVFRDGWITEDSDGTQTWYAQKPLSEGGSSGCDWNNVEDTAWIFIREQGAKESQFLNPPMFRADLHWKDRIVQVGPSVEK